MVSVTRRRQNNGNISESSLVLELQEVPHWVALSSGAALALGSRPIVGIFHS